MSDSALLAVISWTVTLSARRRRDRMAWALITLIFVATTVTNMVERPDGLKIAAIVIVSLVSRVRRAEPDRSRRPQRARRLRPGSFG